MNTAQARDHKALILRMRGNLLKTNYLVWPGAEPASDIYESTLVFNFKSFSTKLYQRYDQALDINAAL